MNYPDGALELAARELCRIRGKDPDGVVHVPGRYGRIPQWVAAMDEVIEHLERREAIRSLGSSLEPK